MARVQTTTYIDDLTDEAGDDVEPTMFGVEGWIYTMDLSSASQKRLIEALAPFTDKAKRVRRLSSGISAMATRSPARHKSSSTVDREQNQAIRAWAKQQGIPVSDRGRIGGEVLQAFERAH